MTTSTYDAPAAPATTRRLTGWVLAALTPPAAWAGWIATSGGYPSDTRHVLWFATVAVGVLAAGAAARPRGRLVAGLSLVAVVSTLATLVGWWSSEDETGLFVIGLLLTAPLVAAAAPALLLLGREAARLAGGGRP